MQLAGIHHRDTETTYRVTYLPVAHAELLALVIRSDTYVSYVSPIVITSPRVLRKTDHFQGKMG